MIFILSKHIVKIICGIGLAIILAFSASQINVPLPAYAEMNYGTIAEDMVQETIESQYPYKSEGYDTLSEWLQAVKNKMQELNVQINELQQNNYILNEDKIKLDNMDILHTYSLFTLQQYESELSLISERTIANQAKLEAEAAEKKRILEQQQKQEAYIVPSNSGVLTPSKGVNWFNGHKETYYNLDMSRVIANAQAMGIQGTYWVREDGVKMYGNYVIVAAQMAKGTIIETSLGTAIVLDYCPAGTIDVAVLW